MMSTETISLRRSKRSAMTPAIGPRNTAGKRRAIKTPAIAKFAVAYEPPESCAASAVVARSPSQSPSEEKSIEFQSLRKAGIARTPRVSSCFGAAGFGRLAGMSAVYRAVWAALGAGFTLDSKAIPRFREALP